MQSVKENLLAAFRYLLKPLVRMAIKNSVTFPDFSEALKKAYVDVATRQMLAASMDVTEEGISLITNVDATHARDILRAVTMLTIVGRFRSFHRCQQSSRRGTPIASTQVLTEFCGISNSRAAPTVPPIRLRIWPKPSVLASILECF